MKPIRKHLVKCNKFRKCVNPKISFISNKALVFSMICGKYNGTKDRTFTGKESIEILKGLCLIEKRFRECLKVCQTNQ